MNSSIGAAVVLVALMFGNPLGVVGSKADAAQFDGASSIDPVSSTDLSARRRAHRATHHSRRHYRAPRPYYYGRPHYYRPYPGISPFFPFGLGYGLPSS